MKTLAYNSFYFIALILYESNYLDISYFIREELVKNGPVLAPFYLGSSFDTYTSGIYQVIFKQLKL